MKYRSINQEMTKMTIVLKVPKTLFYFFVRIKKFNFHLKSLSFCKLCFDVAKINKTILQNKDQNITCNSYIRIKFKFTIL